LINVTSYERSLGSVSGCNFPPEFMQINFVKWHGTGNDFIVVDDRDGSFPSTDLDLIRKLCDRHLGIGSDGLVLIQNGKEPSHDFHMEFFNPDGSQSFCGNGSRCAFAYWSELSKGRGEGLFSAIDGSHTGSWRGGEVAISLEFKGSVQQEFDGADVDFVHNGSPHELVWVADPELVEIMQDGPRRRYADQHAPGGTNVNFLKAENGSVQMRTYERGVEAETLSCGTGVVAAALSAMEREVVHAPVTVKTRGGVLHVEAERIADNTFGRIKLIGPVMRVFEGRYFS
jgi:diaminopimelate epimerase